MHPRPDGMKYLGEFKLRLRLVNGTVISVDLREPMYRQGSQVTGCFTVPVSRNCPKGSGFALPASGAAPILEV